MKFMYYSYFIYIQILRSLRKLSEMGIALHSKIGPKNLQELKRKRKIKNKGRNSLKRYRKYNHLLIELAKWNRKIQRIEKEMINLKFVEARLQVRNLTETHQQALNKLNQLIKSVEVMEMGYPKQTLHKYHLARLMGYRKNLSQTLKVLLQLKFHPLQGNSGYQPHLQVKPIQ